MTHGELRSVDWPLYRSRPRPERLALMNSQLPRPHNVRLETSLVLANASQSVPRPEEVSARPGLGLALARRPHCPDRSRGHRSGPPRAASCASAGGTFPVGILAGTRPRPPCYGPVGSTAEINSVGLVRSRALAPSDPSCLMGMPQWNPQLQYAFRGAKRERCSHLRVHLPTLCRQSTLVNTSSTHRYHNRLLPPRLHRGYEIAENTVSEVKQFAAGKVDFARTDLQVSGTVATKTGSDEPKHAVWLAVSASRCRTPSEVVSLWKSPEG